MQYMTILKSFNIHSISEFVIIIAVECQTTTEHSLQKISWSQDTFLNLTEWV